VVGRYCMLETHCTCLMIIASRGVLVANMCKETLVQEVFSITGATRTAEAHPFLKDEILIYRNGYGLDYIQIKVLISD
jgi:hypothetical protein